MDLESEEIQLQSSIQWGYESLEKIKVALQSGGMWVQPDRLCHHHSDFLPYLVAG